MHASRQRFIIISQMIVQIKITYNEKICTAQEQNKNAAAVYKISPLFLSFSFTPKGWKQKEGSIFLETQI